MRIKITIDSRHRWLRAAALTVPMALAGCYSGINPGSEGDTAAGDDTDNDSGITPGDGEPGSAPLDGPEECVDTRKFFEEEVFRGILQARCYSCHNSNGQAKDTSYILQADDYPGYLEVNYNTVENVSRLQVDGVPLLLAKPTMDGVEHEGGPVLQKDSEEYEILAEMIERFSAPVHCVSDKDIEAYFEGIVDADPVETARKAVFLLGSRFPTPEEVAAVEAGGLDALDQVMDAVMQEDAFYTRIKEIYNDRLHTDAFLPGFDALDALDTTAVEDGGYLAFPGLAAFGDDGAGNPADPDAANSANDAIAREPLNIIENVLRKGAPFTEILTGDYTMVNPASALAYGIGDAQFTTGDPEELVEYNFENWPQAGILSTSVYTTKYPDTPTNRNRARSRFAFEFFLGEDVQRLAARPIDLSSVQATNPTLFDAACTACHYNIDPVAGAFQNYPPVDGAGYRPLAEGEAWYGDMVPPGYKDEEITNDDEPLPWLADRITNDPGFALSVVYTVHKGLTGDDPLIQPLDSSDPNYLALVRAFDAQDYTFKDLAARFENSNYDFRVLLKGYVKTHWFRAIDMDRDLDEERWTELLPMGSSRVLPPEALDRKIIATVGFEWMRNGTSALNDVENYKFFYGGIDSVNVTTRLDEMNGVMANISTRMANEIGCQATAFDLSRPTAERLLFPYVEPADGLENEAAIRDNIKYLHQHVLGENLDDNHPELERTFQVFKAVVEHGQEEIEAGNEGTTLLGQCSTDPTTGNPTSVTEDPGYSVRGWQAVITYLVSDYRFLFE
jgi:hypothetical protein